MDGKWEGDLWKEEHDKDFVFNFKQKGDEVRGFHYHKVVLPDERVINETYKIKGNIRDGYLFAVLDPVSRNIVDSGTVHMKIYKFEDTLKMKGIITGVSSANGEISSITDTLFTQTDSA